MQNKINNLTQLLIYSCSLLHIKCPDIYYFINKNKQFILKDSNGYPISYDNRDMKVKVKYIQFIPKEYVIYVNIDLLDNMILAYYQVLKITRGIYQIKQVFNYRKHKSYDSDISSIISWDYCYSHMKNHKEEFYYPTEIDKNAYTYILMKTLFHIQLQYKITDEKRFNERLVQLQNRYTIDKVKLCFKTYKIENPKRL
jgi:hypothetical protein